MTGLDRLVAAAAALTGGGRRLLGITGPPGAGKSTLAGQLADGVGHQALVVPMDGFHLADAELRRLGRQDRKGAPDTFDADGFVSLLRRLRDQSDRTVYAPLFRRELELAEAGTLAVGPEVSLVIVEGNYLLCDGPFRAVRTLLDQTWFVDLDPAVRRERLVARHVQHGRPEAEAAAWVARSDEQNAAAVEATRARADRIVSLSEA
ncbi:MAG: nucleoside/nucleotide kinase family protein [Frankiales bacterium]|nr:nucleoside/nucleotide kinase family protein [Frankiales bacterium]